MKLHRILFYLLISLLPLQLGRHFWPGFSLISGIRVDYLAPTIYLTDLLVIGILGSWLWKRKKQFSIPNSQAVVRKHWWILAIFCFLLVNVFFAQNRGAALYKLIKIIEFTLLGFYVAKNRFQISTLCFSLSMAVIYSSLLALAQFFRQASLGGVFWWLGERTFNAFTPGIAQIIWEGRLIMRPYATFPHPNVLAGFILVSLVLIATTKTQDLKQRIIKRLGVFFGVIGIAISFSRSAWLVGVLVSFWFLIRNLRITKTNKKFLYFILLCLLFGVGVLFYSLSHLSTEEAISRRLQLNQVAIKMTKQNPLIGVGLNNFVSRLPEFWQKPEVVRFLQPVHNIFLLTFAETGVTGLLIFFWLLILSYRKLLITNNQRLIITLSAILILGLFDHYWLTLQQTQLLFTIILGLVWAKQ